MTTVAVLQCLEKGLVDLDSDVSTILSEWSEPEILTGFDEGTGEPMLVKAKEKITLRRLLTHSSGLGYEFLNPELKKWQEWNKIDSKALEGDFVCSIAELVVCVELTSEYSSQAPTKCHSSSNQAKAGTIAAASTGRAKSSSG
jgi:CubicO group peptidase (beta-lactamase class C family)